MDNALLMVLILQLKKNNLSIERAYKRMFVCSIECLSTQERGKNETNSKRKILYFRK